MRTTSDTASDLPKVSDLPQVSGRGCVCPPISPLSRVPYPSSKVQLSLQLQ